MRHLVEDLIPAPKELRLTGGDDLWRGLVEETNLDASLSSEAYRLKITKGSILISASGERGYHLARQTLAQLRLLTGKTCPLMEIEDEPDLDVRGYMLDISRCKVPRMDHLYRLVDLLSFFKYNQLQLYMEHTFAYAGHETVWEGSSPMTPEEIRELDLYCSDRYIELVPNQNALGHMERWLRHAEYNHLAECPDGFIHPVSGWKPHGSVLYPDSKSLEFIDGLLDQLLPCFRSGMLHLGCDEPWELGQGRSAERVESEGRHAVFTDYVRQLHALAAKHGKRMFFWSDQLRDEPERIAELPDDLMPVVWGYESDHSYEPECRAFLKADRDFLIAPGDSSWNSFTGRLDTCGPNLERAAAAAKAFGANGMLFTSWGDQGRQQVWPTQLPGLVGFACVAWRVGEIQPALIENGLNRYIFKDGSGALGKFWVDLARIDSHIPVKINPINTSFPYDALYAPVVKLRALMRKQSPDVLFPGFSWLELCEKELARADPRCEDAGWLLRESRLAVELTRAGLTRAEVILKGGDPAEAFEDWEACLRRFEKSWLWRSRKGGLSESRKRLADCAVNHH